MGTNDAIHDEVAAKIAAHNAAILADLKSPRTRRKMAKVDRRKRGKMAAVDEPRLFGADTVRVESFRQTERRVVPVGIGPRVPVPMVRRREVRCTDCDYRLVVRAGRVICPKCGQLFGDPTVLRALFDAFPGSQLLGDGERE